MNITRRQFAALTASLATGVFAVAEDAGAAQRASSQQLHARSRRGPTNARLTAAYRHWATERMSQARSRIDTRLRRFRVAPAQRNQILYDVDRGTELIHARIQLLGKDGSITAADDTQIRYLADAIRRDLARHYGRLDSWQLL